MSPWIAISLLIVILIVLLFVLYYTWWLFNEVKDIRNEWGTTMEEIKKLSLLALDGECSNVVEPPPVPVCTKPKRKSRSIF